MLSNGESENIARNIIQKDRWWDILSRVMDVLQMNLFILDKGGKIILPPEESKCGGRFFTERYLGIDFLASDISIERDFVKVGNYYQYECRFGLICCSVPVEVGGEVVAYLVVGPIIVNRRASTDEYSREAEKFNIDGQAICDEINTLRVVSNVMLSSILDMLHELIKNTVALTLSQENLIQEERDHLITHKLKREAEEIYAAVCFDEMLITLLDVALKMTDTECGSIMILNEKTSELTVKAARGLNSETISNTHTKLGTGIAGVAAEINEPIIIHGVESDNNRIAHLLKRGDIKSALVMPLVADDGVFGVLNLHTKRDGDKIEYNLENLQYLSQLISSVS